MRALGRIEVTLRTTLPIDEGAKIANVGLVVESRSILPEKAVRLPMLIVGAKDADSAKFLEETALPKLLAMAGGQ